LAQTGLLPLSTAQLRTHCVALLTDAVELVMLPRIFEFAAFSPEGGLVECMLPLVQSPEILVPYGAAGERLLTSWRRLVQSGVLQRRSAQSAMQSKNAEQQTDTNRACAAAAAAPGLRTCAMAACSAREAHPAHFKSCAACRVPAYCCKAHQEEDWPSHKAACKAARKAAAAYEQEA
jgi:hypothetical protein